MPRKYRNLINIIKKIYLIEKKLNMILLFILIILIILYYYNINIINWSLNFIYLVINLFFKNKLLCSINFK